MSLLLGPLLLNLPRPGFMQHLDSRFAAPILGCNPTRIIQGLVDSLNLQTIFRQDH